MFFQLPIKVKQHCKATVKTKQNVTLHKKMGTIIVPAYWYIDISYHAPPSHIWLGDSSLSHWIASGISTHQAKLATFAVAYDLDVILLSETFLSP